MRKENRWWKEKEQIIMKKIILIALIFSIVLFSGCVDDKARIEQITKYKTDSEIYDKAPGCEGTGGFLQVPTGCLGKSVIKDIKVEPAVECLQLQANNCNGGVLSIGNKCDVDLEIGGKIIHANSYKLIEFVRNGEGKIYVIEPLGNFDSYNPEDEDLLSVKGKLGEKEITISYLKKNVCGEAKIPDIPFLKMDKTSFGRDETVKASVESKKMLFTGFPAFEVYQLVDGEWQWLDIYCMACALPCSVDESEICYELPIVCAPLPEHCMDFDPLVDKFEWDQTVCQIRNVECPNLNETRICSFEELAELGTYKIVFHYSEDCVDKDFFHAEENNVQKIEKSFRIEREI